MPTVSDKRRNLELLAVVITALGKFLFMDYLNWKFPYIAAAVLGWTGYIIYSRIKEPENLIRWGFRKNNFREAWSRVLPAAIIALIICFTIGYINGTLNISWHIIPILVLYPLWGIIQQFLLIGLVVGNLSDTPGRKLKDIHIILISSLLFGVIHYPWAWLMLATFLLALFYSFIFTKVRNVYVLGLFHGWLGAVCFYTVVGRDPFLEVFGKFI